MMIDIIILNRNLRLLDNAALFYGSLISNYIVVGIYMYDNSVINKVKNLKPSNRGELEITDLNNLYLKKEDCEIIYMEKNSVWFDSGDFDSLLSAANFVRRNNIS